MYFSTLEKRAIITFANAMTKADGKIQDDEIMAAVSWFAYLGFSKSDMKMDCLEASQAMTIISNLSYDEKELLHHSLLL